MLFLIRLKFLSSNEGTKHNKPWIAGEERDFKAIYHSMEDVEKFAAETAQKHNAEILFVKKMEGPIYCILHVFLSVFCCMKLWVSLF